MTDFIHTHSGLVRLSAVTRFDYEHGRHVAYYVDGNGVACRTALDGDPERYVGTIIPAAPGYVALFSCDDEAGSYWTQSIVAWRVHLGVAMPVCLESVGDGYAILQPDGQVIEPESDSFSSVDAWQQRLRERFAKRAEQQQVCPT